MIFKDEEDRLAARIKADVFTQLSNEIEARVFARLRELLADPMCVCLHTKSLHKFRNGVLSCTVEHCACGPGCIHEGFVDANDAPPQAEQAKPPEQPAVSEGYRVANDWHCFLFETLPQHRIQNLAIRIDAALDRQRQELTKK